MRNTWKPLLGEAIFYYLITATIILASYAQYLRRYDFPFLQDIKAQPAGVYVVLFGFALSVIFWIRLPFNFPKTLKSKLFFFALIGSWASSIAVAIIHENLFTHSVWLYGLVLILVFMKMPTVEILCSTIYFAAWLLAGVLIVTLSLEIFGVIEVAKIPTGLIDFELTNYWLPLKGWLGPDFRWPGPMGHNAETGLTGAFLVVIGFNHKHVGGVFLGLIGITTLLLTSSRVSMIVVVVGVAIIFALGDNAMTRRLTLKVRLLVLISVGVVAGIVAYRASPNLTGRLEFWQAYLAEWSSSPFIGVALSALATKEGAIAISNGSAHNLLIDALSKSGIFVAIFVLAVMVIALLIVVPVALKGNPLPFALTAVFLINGISQADQSWTTPSTPMWLFLLGTWLAVTYSQRDTAAQCQEVKESIRS